MKQIVFLIILGVSIQVIGSELTVADQRSKNIIKPTNNAEDLQNLGKIQIYNHTLKDFHKYGKNFHKGLIAEQVETLFPEVVTKVKHIIPNIYTLSQAVQIIDDKTIITSKKLHGLKQGDKIKLIIKNQGDKVFFVAKVLNDKQFAIDTILTDNQVFIYGKEVDDFRAVDSQSLLILDISATQALHKITNKLITENHELRKTIKILSKRINSLTERINDIETLLEKQ